MSETPKKNPAQNYEEYFVPGMFARWAPVLLEHVGLKPGERVLDVACGTGVVARCAAPLVTREGSVMGVDASPGMLEVARAASSADIVWQVGDAGSLPDGPFDAILCQQGLQFFPEQARAIAEMRRVADGGARVGVSVWLGLEHHPVYKALCESEARYFDVPIEEVAQPFSMCDADALRELFTSVGFERVEIVQETREVNFPSPDRFVALTLLAAAAVLPDFAVDDEEMRADLVETVRSDMAETLAKYVDGDSVSFPMHAHIVVARA